MAIQPVQLPPLQRDALREMLRSPTHSLVRQGRHYAAQYPRTGGSGPRQGQEFTYRLVRMLDRAYLVDFDEPDFPQRVTLNAHGLQLAQQLRDTMAVEAAQAVERG